MFIKFATDRVSEHVVAEHFGKVVETACASHAVVEVRLRFMVPIVQPTTIELIQRFLFSNSKIRIVVLYSIYVSYEPAALSLESENCGRYAQTLLFGI